MDKIKICISTPDGKTQILEAEGLRAQQFLGKRIGDELKGSVLGFPETNLQITGGTDKDGFPMRRDVHGGVKKAIIISGGTGFKAKTRGNRRRKTIRGNVITDDVVQVNVKVLK